MSDNFKTVHISQDEKPVIRTQYDELNDKILALEKYVKLRLELVEESMTTYNKLNICNQSLILMLILMLIINTFFGFNLVTNTITILMLIPMIIFYCKMKKMAKESSKRLSKLKTEYEEFMKKYTY